jgi:sulfonate transport system substrate-binding protein
MKLGLTSPLKLAVALVLAAGFAAAQAEALPKVIRIGVASPAVGENTYTTGSVGIAHQKHLIEDEFAKDNVKIEWYFYKGAGPAVNEALSNQQLDFAFQGDLPSIIGRSNGLKTRFLFPTDSRQNLYVAVPPDSTAQSVKDLVGKRVAISKGTNGQLPANRLLDANGLTERNLKLVNLENATAQQALATHDIDGVFGGYEYLKFRNKGQARIIFSSASDPRYSRRSGIIVTEEFLQAYPQASVRVAKGILRAARWASDEANRDEVFELWSKMGYPADTFREDFLGFPLRVRLNPLLDPFIVQRYKEAVEDSYKYKLTRKKFDAEQWIYPNVLNAALKELQLENYWTPTDPSGKPTALKTLASK